MRPSSFVFVAIVGLWAAHLLPQWIRRRDALGASRGGDRHSSALRVLARRRRPRTLGRSSAPLLPSIPVVTGPVAEAPVAGPVSFLSTGPGRTPEPSGGRRTARARRPPPPVVLVALGGFTAASVLGAIAGAVPVPSPSSPSCSLGLDVAALRAAAVAGERRRAAEVERARRDAEAERARRVRARPRRCPGPGAAAVAAAAVVEVPDAAARGGPVRARRPRGCDRRRHLDARAGASSDLHAEADRPRPEPAPLEPAVAAAAQPAAAAPSLRLVEEPEVDLDSVLARRRAVNG